MAQPETKIKVSLLKGIVLLAVSAGFSFLGYILLFKGDELPLKLCGLLFLLAFPACLIGVIRSGFGGIGPCPVCNSPIQTALGDQPHILCKTCGSYLDSKKNTLRETAPDTIAAKPEFAAPTPWTDLASVKAATTPSPGRDLVNELITEDTILLKKEDEGMVPLPVLVLDARWPDECCVCGKSTTHKQVITGHFTYHPAGAPQSAEKGVTATANDVPHCDEHKDGADFGPCRFGNPKQDKGFGLRFRSYAYRNKFMELNSWKWV